MSRSVQLAIPAVLLVASCVQYGGGACETLTNKACDICPTSDANEAICTCVEQGSLAKDDVAEAVQGMYGIETDSDAEMVCTDWLLNLAYPGPIVAAECKQNLEYLKQYEANACEDLGWY